MVRRGARKQEKNNSGKIAPDYARNAEVNDLKKKHQQRRVD
jgi:hypothetical protein